MQKHIISIVLSSLACFGAQAAPAAPPPLPSGVPAELNGYNIFKIWSVYLCNLDPYILSARKDRFLQLRGAAQDERVEPVVVLVSQAESVFLNSLIAVDRVCSGSVENETCELRYSEAGRVVSGAPLQRFDAEIAVNWLNMHGIQSDAEPDLYQREIALLGLQNPYQDYLAGTETRVVKSDLCPVLISAVDAWIEFAEGYSPVDETPHPHTEFVSVEVFDDPDAREGRQLNGFNGNAVVQQYYDFIDAVRPCFADQITRPSR